MPAMAKATRLCVCSPAVAAGTADRGGGAATPLATQVSEVLQSAPCVPARREKGAFLKPSLPAL